MPHAVQFFRSVPRWLLVRALASRWSSVASGALSCIELADLPPPPLPTNEWVRIKTRLSGVCGSDLSAIACKGSPYFSPFVSTPFVLGHEIVGDIAETGSAVPEKWKTGMRVIVEPALCCEVRGISPPCKPCSIGHYAHCENILKGSIKGGIQTGYCSSTGGGWSAASVVVHHSQLYAVPESLSDEEAVIAEPFACAIHGALKAPLDENATILVLGCGSIGLLTIYAYRAAGGKGRVLASARYAHQAEMATKLGASEIYRGRGGDELYKWVLQRGSGDASGGIYRPEIGKPVLLGGVDCVIDCVGSSDSIDDSMRLTRPRGTLVLAGMPGIPHGVDWTSVWYKELRVQGAYAYGWETSPPAPLLKGEGGTANAESRGVKTMQLALDFLKKSNGALKPLVNRKFPLQEYRAALDSAFHAGKSGAFKTVFEVK
ncbi:MAG TPA: zinc-binding dehydrogenase [Planctomycetota bacterium]|nr:zinc-binding dehydrogenase [Planctomycetota bacterium]